jgi:hypothetical protein
MNGSNWRNLITRYSQKYLTYQKDLLPALSGITNRVRGVGDYYGGSWKKCLPYDLLWFSSVGSTCPGVNFPVRPEEFIAPSFLWSSVKGHISFVDLEGNKLHEQSFSITHIRCMPKYYDPLGELDSGYIVLDGPYIRAKFINLFERPMPANFIKDSQQGLQCLWATLECLGIGHFIFHPDSLDLEMKNLVCVELFASKVQRSESCYALVPSIGAQDAANSSTNAIKSRRVGIIASIESHRFETAESGSFEIE